jgi:HAD superfamily hydrolase (TIGR01458 family)
MGLRGVLIDLGGVVYQAEAALPGAAGAIQRLRAQGLPIRFLTNTTSEPKRAMLARLGRLGIAAAPGEVFTPADAARAAILAEDLAPHFLIRPALAEDFAGLPPGTNPALVIGDAREGFSYDALNAAFRRLEAGAAFLALASNRVFLDDDGVLSLDMGAFVAALEYASGRKAWVAGKPAPAFFQLAVADMGLAAGEVAMIGDDAEFDVAAARAVGLAGFLVRTGKWKPGSAEAAGLPPGLEFDDLAAVADHLLGAEART